MHPRKGLLEEHDALRIDLVETHVRVSADGDETRET